MLIFPLVNDTSRKIIHIDMDAFFAAIEERDNPKLKGKPIIIAKDPRETGGRGVVSTCNYEARAFGVRSAMSAKEAYERCPTAIFISGRYEHYRQVGLQVREIFKRYTDTVEPMSIDEAYLDVTSNKLASTSAVKIARLIQQDIWLELGLTCSAGISYNKFLAKLASDFQKPRGLTLILPEEAQAFLSQLPIEKFHGVGQKTVTKLHEMGVFTGADLLAISEMTLIDHFGRFGYDLYRKARGISNSPVLSNRKRKSIGSEKTYAKLLYQEEDILAEVSKHLKKVCRHLQTMRKKARVLTLKIRYADFTTTTKRITLDQPSQDFERFEKEAYRLIKPLEPFDQGIRLLGASLSELSEGFKNTLI